MQATDSSKGLNLHYVERRRLLLLIKISE